MKKIINAFSVPILEAILPDAELINESLNPKIQKLFNNISDKRLLGHYWHSNILTDETPDTGYSSFNHGSLTDDKNFNDFFATISPVITEFFNQLNFNQTWDFINAWANVYPHGSFVPHHNHGTAHWSGSYYVNAAENCGDIILHDPKEYALNNEPPSTKWRGNISCPISVLPGKLVIFPGYLKHETKPNLSSEDRTIISFNIICQ
jgi:uncharacterized protein (TIGR02466 family)